MTLCDATGAAPHGLAALDQEDGSVKLTFSGGVSKRFEPFFDLYPLEVSDDLLSWQVLELLQRTNNATADLTFVDPTPGMRKRSHRTAANHFIAAYAKPTGPYPSSGSRSATPIMPHSPTTSSSPAIRRPPAARPPLPFSE